MDETKTFVVQLQGALANFKALRVIVAHANGTQTEFDVLAGQQPLAMQGETVYVGAVVINNGGNGDCFIEILFNGVQLWRWDGFLNAGETSGIFSWAAANANPFTMPVNDVTIIANAGH